MNDSRLAELSLISSKTNKWMKTEEFLGWTIECESAPSPIPYEFYGKSLCFGKFIANKPVPGGRLYLVQPFWLSLDELRALTTPLAKADGMDYMLKKGKQAIKHSIRKHWKGELDIPVTMDVPVITSDKWREQRFIV